MSYYPAAYPQWPINCNCFNLHSDESEEEKRQCAKDSKLVYSDDSLTSVECDIPDELFEKYLTARKKRIFRGEIKKTAFEERCLKAAFIMKQKCPEFDGYDVKFMRDRRAEQKKFEDMK